jgi:hypothetical protein
MEIYVRSGVPETTGIEFYVRHEIRENFKMVATFFSCFLS